MAGRYIRHKMYTGVAGAQKVGSHPLPLLLLRRSIRS